jgi:imidazolonepropionase-like amidohydrolase
MHRAVAEEAASQGLPVMGHGSVSEEVVRSVTLGYRALEHNGSPEVLHDDVLMLLAVAGTYWTPQYTQWIPVDEVLALKDPEGFTQGLRLLGQDGRRPEELRLGEPVDGLLGAWALTSRQLKRARELGVHVLLGTDTYGGPGWVHVEFEAFQDAGFTQAEVLRMATLDAARAEGVDEHLGTLEVGKLADLLLLDDDPLADVRNLRAPWLVMRGGRVVHERDGG